MTQTRLYTLGMGGFAGMFRKSVGQRFELSGYPAHEFTEGSKPGDAAVPLYRHADGWRPDGCIFEIRDPQGIAHGSNPYEGRKAAKSFVIVRELTSAEVFGPHFPRAERFVSAMERRVTLGQVEQLLTRWRELADGWEQCQCAEGDDCPHEPAQGSRSSLIDFGQMAYENGESVSLLTKFADPFAQSYAGAVWWYHAGQEALDISEPGHWRADAGGLGTLWGWQQQVRDAINGLIGSALMWPEMANADQASWSQITSGVLSADST